MNEGIEWKDQNLVCKQEASVSIVLASKYYPNAYDKGAELPENEIASDVFIVHAGTKNSSEPIVSHGGRVLLVGAVGETIEVARNKVYENLKIYDHTDAFFYRSDIGKTSL